MGSYKTLINHTARKHSDLEKKILVVEDDDVSFSLLKEILGTNNLIPHRAFNGREAVEYFSINKYAFDLVLMDIRLPELNGCKATQQIKDINPSVPVIAITAYAHSQCIIDCYDAGCDEYVTKPYDISKILSLVDLYALKN